MTDFLFMQKSGFYDSIAGDRRYFAEDMNYPFRDVFSDGIMQTDYLDSFAFALKDPETIIIEPGFALLSNHWIASSRTDISIQGNRTDATRIDSIILRSDARTNFRSGFLIYRTGGAAAPDLVHTAQVGELRLLNVAVPPDPAEVTEDALMDMRGTEDCPFVEILLATAGYKAGQGIKIEGNTISASGGGGVALRIDVEGIMDARDLGWDTTAEGE